MKDAPNCYLCANRRDVPGACHSSCVANPAKVTGDPGGIRRGWFAWPYNFDPTWLVSCNSFVPKGDKK